jgi:hypothetical protein
MIRCAQQCRFQERQMETDDALAVGCELVEQGLAHRRGTLGIMMVGSGHPVGMRKRNDGMGEGVTENYHALGS